MLVLDGLGASQNVGQVLRTAYHLGRVWGSLKDTLSSIAVGRLRVWGSRVRVVGYGSRVRGRIEGAGFRASCEPRSPQPL